MTVKHRRSRKSSLTAKHRASLSSFAKSADKESVLSSFIVLKKGKEEDLAYDDEPCHASLRPESVYSDSVAISTLVRESNKHRHQWIGWLRLSSPWSKYILNKTTKSVFEVGLIVDSKAPAAMLFQVSILARYLWEMPSIVKAWSLLVKDRKSVV